MPLHVLPATDADAPRAFEIEHLAYNAVEDAINALLFPGPMPADANDKRAEDSVKEKAGDPSTVWIKVVDDELDGRMIAFAEWHIYAPGAEVPKPKVRSFGPGSDPKVCAEFFGPMDRKRVELMGNKPHVFLKYLHTDPAHQKRGAGSMLIKWGLAKADELKLPAYLEASKAGKPLYLKHGFEEIDRLEYDLTKWGGEGVDVVVNMLKSPGAEA